MSVSLSPLFREYLHSVDVPTALMSSQRRQVADLGGPGPSIEQLYSEGNAYIEGTAPALYFQHCILAKFEPRPP